MICMLIGDPRSRAGGRLTGSGPSGVTWLQPATASTTPASAVSTKNACPVLGLTAMPPI